MKDDTRNSLRQEPTRGTLKRLHAQARQDRLKFLGLAPSFLRGLLAGKSFSEQITPKLRPRAVVLADNIFTFKRDLKPYVDHVQCGRNGFESATLHISDGFEYSVRMG